MVGGLIRRLWGQTSKQNVRSAEPVLEVDWSVISGAGLGLIFKALLADLVGAPPPPELEAERIRSKQAWKFANVEDTYFHRNLATSVTKGFLIRGVIYDMSSLIQARGSAAGSEVAQANSDSTGKQVFKARDWTSLVDADISKEHNKLNPNGAEATIEAADVIENLGLSGVIPGLASRVQGGKSKRAPKQNLEEIVGKADGIRAKYADKIRTKKILADVRREQRELGIRSNPVIRSTGSKKGWRIVPGSPALIRYLEARKLAQGLIARGQEDDLESFLEEIGNYQFQHISRVLLQGDAPGDAKKELSAEVLKNVCDSWGIPPKQILLVCGEGSYSQALTRACGDLGFFLCEVKGAQLYKDSEETSAPSELISLPRHTDRASSVSVDLQRAVSSMKVELQSNRGLRTWFRKLAAGTLDADNQVQVAASQGVHFTVADMIELKWVVEDLNGVSYRRSTMISGFEEMVGRNKELTQSKVS